MREVKKERRHDLKSVVVLFVEVSFEGTRGQNVTDVRRERILNRLIQNRM